MAEEKRRPRGREKNVTGKAKDVYKRGDGLGTGPVGSEDGYAGKKADKDKGLVEDLISAGINSALGGSGSSSGHSNNSANLGNILGGMGGSSSGHSNNSANLGNILGGMGTGSSQGSSQSTHYSSSNKPNTIPFGSSSGSGSSGKKRRSLLPTIIIILIIFYLLSRFMSCGSDGGSENTGSLGTTGNAGTSSTASYSSNGSGGTANSTYSSNGSGSTNSGSASSTYSSNGSGSTAMSSAGTFDSLFGSGNTYSSWGNTAGNTASVSTSVASGVRDKRTVIQGGGRDVVTIMVYMCGTDLESKSGMGTSDLMEMTKANIAENVNLIVYTGGCRKWNNSVISSSVNQIYKVESGGLARLVENAGTSAMTNPANLTSFINFCTENFPANRNELIFWDHGSGSVAGYGYDEKNARSGGMTLAGIKNALKDSGAIFDFIGFDACLMGTAENAMMLEDFADYLIASEETEPGVGWYYTDWLSALSANTSIPTTELGKTIIDSFVNTCARKCAGQKTTLSLIDLAEFNHTVPEKLSAFSRSITTLLSGSDYKTVANARYQTREFAASSKIDPIDLVDLCNNLGNAEGKALANAVLGAVKYNRTSADMSDAYGCAIYFPYRRTDYVDNAVSVNNQIGVSKEYSECIQQMASMAVSGQLGSGGSQNPYSSLFGGSYGFGSGSSGSSSYNSSFSASDIESLLNAFMGGDTGSLSGFSSGNTSFFGRSIPLEDAAAYVAENHIDPSELVWSENADGETILAMSENNWELVFDLDKNVFLDDGAGYIDLGLDNVYDFDDDGNLVADTENTWLAINGQPVAYYHVDTVDDGTNYRITGRVPAFLNDERVNLLLVFDNDHPSGYIAGAVYVTSADGMDLIGKSMVASDEGDEAGTLLFLDDGTEESIDGDLCALKVGDRLDFLCDYYTYDGNYSDTYLLGDPMEVSEEMTVSDVELDGAKTVISYRLTDIYNSEYWMPALEG